MVCAQREALFVGSSLNWSLNRRISNAIFLATLVAIRHLCLVHVFGRRGFQAQSDHSPLLAKRTNRSIIASCSMVGFVRKETHVLVGDIKIYHFCRAVIRDFTQESRQFRHFDVGAETLFAFDRTCHVQLVVSRFLSKYSSPCVKATHTLLGKLFRAQVLEKHVQFGQSIYDHRTRQERSPQVPFLCVLVCHGWQSAGS